MLLFYNSAFSFSLLLWVCAVGGEERWEIRPRLVARDLKGGDKGRDDLCAEAPPLEGKRILMSRAATRRKDGRYRKLMFIDARKAHLNPKCQEPA